MKQIKTLLLTGLLMLFFVTASIGNTVYEDAEDGNTVGWRVYDDDPTGATIENVYDHNKTSRVIQFSGDGIANGYMLGELEGMDEAWNNNMEKGIKWSMKYSEEFIIYVRIMTFYGPRYIQYTPNDSDGVFDGSNIIIGIGSESNNGKWHTFTRDLESDLKQYEPDNELLSVNAFVIRGSGLVDDIELYSDTTPPVITLNGSNPMVIVKGLTFIDPGATAIDNIDGSVLVTESGTVDSSTVGSYTRTYIATDKAGNTATVTRLVIVQNILFPHPDELQQDTPFILGGLISIAEPLERTVNSGTSIGPEIINVSDMKISGLAGFYLDFLGKNVDQKIKRIMVATIRDKIVLEYSGTPLDPLDHWPYKWTIERQQLPVGTKHYHTEGHYTQGNTILPHYILEGVEGVPILTGFHFTRDDHHNVGEIKVHLYRSGLKNGVMLDIELTDYRYGIYGDPSFDYEVSFAMVPENKVANEGHLSSSSPVTGSDVKSLNATYPVLQGFRLEFVNKEGKPSGEDHKLDEVGVSVGNAIGRVWYNDKNDDDRFVWDIWYADVQEWNRLNRGNPFSK